ncbi:MAG: FlgD immunoglobulin-like domain containing protein, partial [Candidatus Zixiibacteriota bacterium]
AFVYTWAVEMLPAFVKGEITIKEKNLAPQIQPIGTQYVTEGDTLLIKISANDPEGDSVKISMLNGSEGSSFADSGNGKATFLWVPPLNGPWSSVNSPFKVIFVALDGNSTSKENVEINVIDKNLGAKGYVLEIGADTGFFQDFVTVPIRLINPDSIGAMKLLLNFDHTALSLDSVSKLNTRIDNWEYFQYRLNQPEIGDVLILAAADVPNPTLTPPLPPGSGVVANLNFQVILDPCPISLSTFVRYIFTDSTDNTLSSALGQELIGQNDIEYKDGYVLIQCPNDVTEGEENNSALPKTYELSQNYPNPFNPVTQISFALPQESEVSLVIYNIKGQIVNKLINERMKAGRYKVTWEGTDSAGNRVASGIYFYRIKAGKYSETKKMIMVN